MSGLFTNFSNFVSLIGNQSIDGIKNFLQNTGLGITTPQAKLHIDAGTGAASNIKFTAGTTTGQTITDGFNVGISSTGAAEINQLENNTLSFFTNNIPRMSIDAIGDLYLGRNANILAATISNSPTTGALIVAGGVGVGGTLNVGNSVSAANILSSPFVVASNFIQSNTYTGVSAAATVNNSAPNINIQTGSSTGNAISANIIFSTSNPTTSGTVLQSHTEKMRLSGNGNLLIGTTVDDAANKLQVNGGIKAIQFRLSALNTPPASATDMGTTGEIRIDANFIYVCIATNTWRRASLSTW